MSSLPERAALSGYLASRRSADLVVAANQLLTLEWWTDHRHRFELFVSQATIDECSAGDLAAARERLIFVDGLPVLVADSKTQNLAQELIGQVGLPAKAAVDAIHIAIAAQNSIDYLLTWNWPRSWQAYVNEPQSENELESVRQSVIRGTPYGSDSWVTQSAVRPQLKHTLRSRGRPKKSSPTINRNK